jgi:hypothetical protein
MSWNTIVFFLYHKNCFIAYKYIIYSTIIVEIDIGFYFCDRQDIIEFSSLN